MIFLRIYIDMIYELSRRCVKIKHDLFMFTEPDKHDIFHVRQKLTDKL